MPEDLKTTIATYVAMLCEAFARKPTKATYMAYEAGLQGLSADRIKTACIAALQQNRQFMPTPGELRELGLAGGRMFDAVAADAWQLLNDGIRKVGASGSPNFADGLVNAAVRHLGGWERVCKIPDEEFEKWFRKDFQSTYLNFLRNGCSQDLCKPLVGSIERESGSYHGLPNPRTGKVYELPRVVDVSGKYQPQVPSLPAPERKPAELPLLQLKRVDPEPAEPVKPSRMKRKKDFPKHLQWNEKADLEYDLSPEQIERQEKNRALLQQLVNLTPEATRDN